jgi:hypothetical protein
MTGLLIACFIVVINISTMLVYSHLGGALEIIPFTITPPALPFSRFGNGRLNPSPRGINREFLVSSVAVKKLWVSPIELHVESLALRYREWMPEAPCIWPPSVSHVTQPTDIVCGSTSGMSGINAAF